MNRQQAGVVATAMLCLLSAVVLLASDCCAAAVPRAVFQDSDRPNRRSPAQFKQQLLPGKSSQKAALPLPAGSDDARAAKTRNLIAEGKANLATPPAQGGTLPMLEEGDWRLKIRPAAVTRTDMVCLGDIAVPLGSLDNWAELAKTELWPAPPQEGKPLQINRAKLSEALHQGLGRDLAGRCILPTSLVIQRGGALFAEDALRSYVVNSLTPQLRAMPGEAELTEFRLPEYIFLANTGQRVQLEVGKLTPGRISVRFAIQEADGTVLRRVSGTVNLALWLTVPTAARPIAKGDPLTPDAVTFTRVNAQRLRDTPWDGQGGPWRAARTLQPSEPILQADLASQLMIRRGDVVTLIYARGNLKMSTHVEALADGEPGATIPVRNLQSKKQVFATVKDGNTVEIH